MLVRNLTKQTNLGEQIDVADTSEKRRRGLLKHTQLNAGEGLWIAPTESVHSFGMKFAIDVLYLSKDRKVVKVKNDMVPSRISLCLKAYSVLELPSGTAAATGTAVGDQLEFVR
jgi:uncharacterized protein